MLYHEVANAYTWGSLLPLPAGTKTPPPEGYTGEHGAPVTDAERQQWANHDGNYALRLPDGVVGLDVDHYDNKIGLHTLQQLEQQLGALPLTFMSTGRDPATGSGIRFFRYPGGKLASTTGASIDVIQHTHRYAAVWPSVAGERVYRWWGHDGDTWISGAPPALEHLPELPTPWVEYLRQGAAAARGPAAPDAVRDTLLADLNADTRNICHMMETALNGGMAKVQTAGEGGRHDAMTGAVLSIVATGAEGHSGTMEALGHMHAAWDEAIGNDPSRAGEFDRMVTTAAGKIATNYPQQVKLGLMHYCWRPEPEQPQHSAQQVGDVYGVPVEYVTGEDEHPPTPTEAPKLPEPLVVFDPPGAMSDRDIALAVLGHHAPVVAFAHDAQTWLHRKNGAWNLEPASLAEHAKTLSVLAGLAAPRGDAEAEAGTPGKAQAHRWGRLTSSAGVNAVAGMVRSLAPTMHSIGVNLAELDTDPELLWAGGVPFDLAKSAQRPVPAALDPNTVHMASALCLPAKVPTPQWDAFIAATFPDEEQRAWVLRLLGVAVTGHSDATLPILYGPAGTGKTSLLRFVARVLGTYSVAPSAMILDASNGGTSEEFALLGKRMAYVDEGPRSSKWATEKLKALTGGGSMRARALYKSEVEWAPQHTLFMSSNDFPQVADPGLRRRVRAVHVAADPEAVGAAVRAIEGNKARWAAELPGVLWKLMQEAAGYIADPTSAANPMAVEADMESLSREQDPIISWLDERTLPGGPTKAMDLWDDFRGYGERIGTPRSMMPTMTSWGRRLTALGYPSDKTRKGKVRHLELLRGGGGIGPVTSWEAPGRDTPHTRSGVSVNTESSRSESSESKTEGPDGDQLGDQLVTIYPANWSQTKGVVNPQVSGSVTSVTSYSPISLNEVKGVYKRENVESLDLGVQLVTESRFGPDSTNEAGADSEALKLPAFVARGADPEQLTLTQAAAHLVELFGGTVVLDIEHTGYPYGHEYYAPRTFQLGTRDWCVDLDASDPEQADMAAQILDAAAEIVAHSATADVSLLALAIGRDAAPWWDKTTDTAILAALADPELTNFHKDEGALGLKKLAARLTEAPVAPAADKLRAARFRTGGGKGKSWLTITKPETPLERSGWAQVDPADPVMVAYACADVLDTGAVHDALPKPAPAVMARERRTQGILARLPERGLLLDAERIAELTVEHEDMRTQWAETLRERYGITDPGSNPKVAAAFEALGANLPRTDKGALSTAADAVERIAGEHGPAQDMARMLLEYRKHEKVCSTYLRPLGLQVSRGDGRSYPTILTLGAAATGRMSSVRPNIQQMPRDGGMRGMFIADPGHVFIGADFSSVEVRIAAAITGDEKLADMVRQGIDLHGAIAEVGWGITPEHDGFKAARTSAKSAVFRKLYGGGIEGMRKAMALHGHGDKAGAVVGALESLTPGLMEWDKQLREAVRSRAVKTWTHPSGRVAYFNADMPHKSLNTAVQGFGRELLVDSLLRWEDMHPGHTIVLIHDEMIIQVPEADSEALTADLVACMTTELPVAGGHGTVPIVAEADAPTRRWGTVEL